MFISKAKILTLFCFCATGHAAAKNGYLDTAIEKIKKVPAQTAEINNIYNPLVSAQRAVDTFNRKQVCYKLYLDEIVDEEPRRNEAARKKAANALCKEFFTL